MAFDAHAATFRHQMYDGYKANRAPMPEDLRAQDPVIRELISLMGIPLIEKPGYEADDILGTLSLLCEQSGDDALIVTGDRDSFQLAGPHTHILYTRKGLSDTVVVDEAYIAEKYGVSPGQLIDVKSLMGDASDNVPGVSGVGEKTALRLVAQYGNLENALAQAETGEKGKLREPASDPGGTGPAFPNPGGNRPPGASGNHPGFADHRRPRRGADPAEGTGHEPGRPAACENLPAAGFSSRRAGKSAGTVGGGDPPLIPWRPLRPPAAPGKRRPGGSAWRRRTGESAFPTDREIFP